MTIKEFAKKRGVSTQAVYARIKAAGVELSSIKKEKSAELTEDGLKTLTEIFSSNEGDCKGRLIAYARQIESKDIEIESLKKELEEEKANAEKWKAQVEHLTELLQQAQQTALNAQEVINKLHESLQEAQKTAQQAQALQLASLKALPAPRLTLWERLTGKKRDKLEG